MRKTRVVLVDDHRMVRESLANALRGFYDVVGLAANGEELFRVLSSRPADCVLLDLELPGVHGMEVLRRLRTTFPDLRVIVVTMHSDQVLANASLRAGADGFVPKDAGVDELRKSITEVVAGRRYVSTRVSRARHRVGPGAPHQGLSRLTPRQQEILLLLGEGKSAATIAERLGVGQSTIGFHKQNIMRALGLDSNDALVTHAVLLRTAADLILPGDSATVW